MIVVFDFDGVLLDSNRVKRDAYFQLFAHFAADEVVAACLAERPEAHRFEQIDRILGRLGAWTNGKDRDRWVTIYARQYGRICETETARCREIPGASEALRVLTDCHPLYVNSATWEPSLRAVIARRGWSRYFCRIFGAPRSKVENLQRIMASERAFPEELVFVGDSAGDYQAARHCGVQFVGVRGPSGQGAEGSLIRLEDLFGLPRVLNELARGRSDAGR